MNILIVNMYYFPNMMGGAEYSVKLLAEGLAQKGQRVSVLTMDGTPEGNIEIPEQIAGVYVYRSYCPSIYRRRILGDKSRKSEKLKNGLLSIRNPQMNRDIREVVRMTEPDVIHTNNLVSMSCWIWLFAGKHKIKTVHTLRDYWLLDPTTEPGKSRGIFLTLFKGYHRKLSNRIYGAVTSPSERTMQIFQEEGYFRNCVRKVIVNSIFFDRNLLEECTKKKVKRENEKIIFLYAGTLTENKGVRILIQAFLEAGLRQAELHLYGEGDLKEWIAEKTKGTDAVKLFGKVRQDVLFEGYRKADVMIVPSVWEEPFGRIVIEAAQYALPVIGSNRGGIPETVHAIGFGDVYQFDSADELCGLITKYTDRVFVRQMIETGPDHMENYAIERQIERMEDLYRRL